MCVNPLCLSLFPGLWGLSFDLIRFVFPSYKFSRLLAIGRLVEPMKVMSRLDGPAA